MRTPYEMAVTKAKANQECFLNFHEVRAVDKRHGKSFERELEMRVDNAVNYNVGLSGQFFTDAHGPKKGYTGAIECLSGYVGDPCAEGMTIGQVDQLKTQWRDIAHSIKLQIC